MGAYRHEISRREITAMGIHPLHLNLQFSALSLSQLIPKQNKKKNQKLTDLYHPNYFHKSSWTNECFDKDTSSNYGIKFSCFKLGDPLLCQRGADKSCTVRLSLWLHSASLVRYLEHGYQCSQVYEARFLSAPSQLQHRGFSADLLECWERLPSRQHPSIQRAVCGSVSRLQQIPKKTLQFYKLNFYFSIRYDFCSFQITKGPTSVSVS